MHKRASLLLLLLVLLPGASAAQGSWNTTLTLTAPNQTVAAGDTATYVGTLTNNSATSTAFIRSDDFNLALLLTPSDYIFHDDGLFNLLNFDSGTGSFFLLPSSSISGALFTVDTTSSAPVGGPYSGAVTLFGDTGDNSGSQSVGANLSLRITAAVVSVTPEPGLFPLACAFGVAGYGLLRRRRPLR